MVDNDSIQQFSGVATLPPYISSIFESHWMET